MPKWAGKRRKWQQHKSSRRILKHEGVRRPVQVLRGIERQIGRDDACFALEAWVSFCLPGEELKLKDLYRRWEK